MIKIVTTIAMALFISGCASGISQQESDLLVAQMTQPTFKIECPDTGCNFSNFEYHDPSKQVDMPTNGYDVANTAVGSLSSVLLGIAPYIAISSAFSHMNDGTNISGSYNSDDRNMSDNSSLVNDSRNMSDNSITDTRNMSDNSSAVAPALTE